MLGFFTEAHTFYVPNIQDSQNEGGRWVDITEPRVVSIRDFGSKVLKLHRVPVTYLFTSIPPWNTDKLHRGKSFQDYI